MNFVYDNLELQQAIGAATSLEALDAALVAVGRLVPTFAAPEIRGRQMFCPGLDATVPVLARKLNLRDAPGGPKSNDNVCIVATRFYPTGGHSKVAADISRLIGRAKVTIIFTDIYGQLRPSQLVDDRPEESAFQRRATLILAAQTLTEKILELNQLLRAIQPTRIFLIGNHMDMVATAGVWPFRDVVDYVHHADHLPTLGATLPFSGHADLTYTCHRACREAGVAATYVGMTVDSAAAPLPARAEESSAPPRIATCGDLAKYRRPARHRWSEFVVEALRATGGELLHIGPWDEDFAAEMRAALTAAGLDPARYRLLGPLDNLAAQLVARQADVYLASYPDTGGKANLEAMAAGLAPIVSIPEDLPPLTQFDLPMADWIRISSPAEIPEAITRSLALSRDLRTPEGRARLRAEFEGFERFVLSPG